MLLNKSDPHIDVKLRHEGATSPVAQALSAALDAVAEPFEVEVEGAGLEVRACGVLPNGTPNRARLKIFSPSPGHTLVFFYKKSQLPYSRDRYSYGGIEVKDDRIIPDGIADWVAFVSSGFHPDRRPSHLRRAFPYEIPE